MRKKGFKSSQTHQPEAAILSFQIYQYSLNQLMKYQNE